MTEALLEETTEELKDEVTLPVIIVLIVGFLGYFTVIHNEQQKWFHFEYCQRVQNWPKLFLI